MYKYDGLLVHESFDDLGILEVIDCKGIRSLHFGTHPRQSSMRLNAPDVLELDYVRAMTSWLLFKPDLADDALLIGLGGGSLAKHLLHHFPDCRLTAVEYRQSVVKIARSLFGLPLDPRLKIRIDEGGHYLRQRAETDSGRYSLVFVDAYDHEAMASSIASAAFFDACKAVLKPSGMMVINLWGGDYNAQFQQITEWLLHIFNQQVLFLPIPDRSNVIGLAFNGYTPQQTLPELRSHALVLEQRLQIEFPRFLKDLKKHNPHTFNQVIKS
ncbi:MAG: spermine synthase [Methylococcaceae bacterium]|nr:spermine synthase [Methylococcaceae bacterium]